MNEKSIFNTARNISDLNAREEYLRLACAEDPEMKQRLDEMLDQDDEHTSFLDAPIIAKDRGLSQGLDIEQVGSMIGPYKLLQQIGEGGMGTVFMADQTEPVTRRVALKLIKPGMDTKQVIARFEAERQALAIMDHPNIARVLDVGTSKSGRPYFVMELVKGTPITKYCDEHRLDVKQRLELFNLVCTAVQHAHQKGIIHRDIKPSNVLAVEYDDKVVPKIIDFGLAKALNQRLTQKTMFTELGQVVGTLEYMSPEQSKLNQLDVDTRTDIYSLGVLLYELLTGSLPFDRQRLRSEAFDEVLRIIREEDPPKPSIRLSSSDSKPVIAESRSTEVKKLGSRLRGDLDLVVMKALEKDRNRRYATALDLASDIDRHLLDQPVVASPPSPIYRLQKFSKRNKSSVIVASSIVVLSLIGLVIGGWVRQRVNHQNTKSRIETTVSSLNVKRGIVLPELDKLDAFPRSLVQEELERQLRSESQHRQFPLALALAHLGDVRIDELVDCIAESSEHEAELFVAAFAEAKYDSLKRLRAEAEIANTREDWNLKARIALVSFYLGESELVEEMCRLNDRPEQRTHFVVEGSSWHGQLSVFRKYIDSSTNDAINSALIQLVGTIDPQSVPQGEREQWAELITQLFLNDPSALTHSVSRWFLAQWNTSQPNLEDTNSLDDSRDWSINSVGMTMLVVPAGAFAREARIAYDSSTSNSPTVPAQTLIDGVGDPIEQVVEISRPFLLADREVTLEQFQYFLEDESLEDTQRLLEWSGADPRSPTIQHPVQKVNWYDAVAYCNWLSHRERLDPCYVESGDTIELGGKDWPIWQFDRSASGYRLPTEAEWEHACRAGTASAFSHGDDPRLTQHFATFRGIEAGVAGSKWPNGWGFFDMAGNVWEWCHDQHEMYPQSPQIADPIVEGDSQMRILRGGDFISLDTHSLQSGKRHAFMSYYRRFNHGFRVARNLAPNRRSVE